VGRNVSANTDLKAQHIIYAVVPAQNKSSNEKAGHQPAARYQAKYSSRVKYMTFPTAYLLFFLCCHLSRAHCMYLFYCLQTHSVCESL